MTVPVRRPPGATAEAPPPDVAAPAHARPADTHRIRDDAEALAVATRLVPQLRAEAAQRDADRRLPHEELGTLSASGLLAVTVPAAHGGADVRPSTTAEIVRLLATADPNIAQIPHSHFVYLEVLRSRGSASLQRLLFAEVLAGRRLGNAQSELGTRHHQEYRTRVRAAPDGTLRVNGLKHYSTGALFADWVPVLALDDGGRLVAAFVRSGAPGVTIADDWDGIGQRTTASGTVRLDDVVVAPEQVAPYYLTFTGPQIHGAFAQLLHAAIDAGIARSALAEAVQFVRTRTRPAPDSGVDRASDDPLLVQEVGELEIAVRASEALLAEAGRAVDAARDELDDASAIRASLAVAAAKVHAARSAVATADALFELSGTRSALRALNLDRYWRDARTHTLHDPARWKVQHLGRHTLHGTPPPRHGQI